MIAPACVSICILLICIRWIGVSRIAKINRRRSFRKTSAARVMSVSERPLAIRPIVPIEQGQTIIASYSELPEANGALKSSLRYTVNGNSSGNTPVSCAQTSFDLSENTTFARSICPVDCNRRNSSRRSLAYIDPLAPVTATIIFNVIDWLIFQVVKVGKRLYFLKIISKFFYWIKN